MRTLTVSSSGMACPSCRSSGQLSDEQVDSRLELVGKALERGVSRFVGLPLGGRVREAPVGFRLRAGKLRAHFANLVAEGDDPVEAHPHEASQVLRGIARDVDSPLSHHPHGVWVERLGMTAGAACFDRVSGALFKE